MPSYRIGFGSDFNLRDAKVGIGTTLGRTKLDVVGVSKADFNVTGVTTLTSYGGFVGQKQNITKETTTGFSTTGVGTFVQVNETQTGFENLSGDFNTVSEDIIVDEGRIFQVSSGSTVSVGTLEHVSIGTHFSVPKGGITSRPREPREGMVRFNDDLNTLEFYNGVEWRQFTVTGASGRGVFGGGQTPTSLSTIDFINISSAGNASNFGNLTTATNQISACSNSTRGLFGGGTPGGTNVIEYITIVSEGNAIDFGDLTVSRRLSAACSSSTRGIFGGGTPVLTNTIDYVSISTIGNAIDFGDLTSARRTQNGAASSPTRGVFLGGRDSSYLNVIEFITISSTGNATDFGDSLFSGGYRSGCSNTVRAVYGGGYNNGLNVLKTIEYLTIATTGNSIYFGDLFTGRYGSGACSSSTRGIFGGGATPTILNTIDYVTIMSTGNAIDFGDLSGIRTFGAALSDSHGGLGGF